MPKIKIAENAFTYPMPMVIAGTSRDNRPNFMAVGWVTRVNFKPPMIGIALGKSHYTNNGIRESNAFSINIPGVDLLEKTDYAGLVSGSKMDKSMLFTVMTGESTGTPMIRECKVCMECRLVQVVDLPTNEIFIGEIINAYIDDDCLTDGKPDVKKIEPFTLTMPDNHYWSIGKELGRAWGIGSKLIGKI